MDVFYETQAKCLLSFFKGCLPTVFRPCGAVFTCGAIAFTAGVDLSIPPGAPADEPAMYHPLIGTLPAVQKYII